VRNLQVNCEVVETGFRTKRGRNLYTVQIEVGPGEAKSFSAQDLE
jgi:hypothetical protein